MKTMKSTKIKRLVNGGLLSGKKREVGIMEGIQECKKRGGRPRGSGWKQKKREEEIEQLLEDHGEFFSLVLV